MPAPVDPLPPFVDGQPANAADVNVKFATLYGWAQDGIDEDSLANGAVTTPKIADAAVTDDKIGGEISGSHFADDAIPGAKVSGTLRALDGVTYRFAFGVATLIPSGTATVWQNATVTHGLGAVPAFVLLTAITHEGTSSVAPNAFLAVGSGGNAPTSSSFLVVPAATDNHLAGDNLDFYWFAAAPLP